MASPYTSQSISGYNDNPPPDDGSTTEANRVKWVTIKNKLADPPKTLAEAINAAVATAFTKVIGGGGVASSAISYQVLSTDQGKLIRVTASGTTVTTPDATDVDDPFIFSVLNQSTGTITLDGSGTQTVNGNLTATIPPNGGATVWTDGSNWFAIGLTGTPVGKELHYGNVINGAIAESNATNAVTFALKTLAGTDPSTDDPVLLAFRSATAGNGGYTYRTVTAALSMTISSGSTLGTFDGTAFKVWIVLFDDGGTIRMGAINCATLNASGIPTNVYPLGRAPLASSTAEGGAGAADSAAVFYTASAVTAKPYLILGYAEYASGVTTAGSWNASPTILQLFGTGTPLPGHILQRVFSQTGAVATGSDTIPIDDTIPQNGEGDEYMSAAITPVFASSALHVRMKANLSSTGTGVFTLAMCRDAIANAIASTVAKVPAGSQLFDALDVEASVLSTTTGSTTFRAFAGQNGAGTTTFNGVTGGRVQGGALNSYIKIEEVMT